MKARDDVVSCSMDHAEAKPHERRLFGELPEPSAAARPTAEESHRFDERERAGPSLAA
jgi:hypothetical protein